MISNVSFKGNVFWSKGTKTSKPEYNLSIQKFADSQNCDVFVVNRHTSYNGKPCFDALYTKLNPSTCTSILLARQFDFSHKNQTQYETTVIPIDKILEEINE